MSAESAKEMVELLDDITQVGIVIEDMEKAKAGMLKVFGLKPMRKVTISTRRRGIAERLLMRR